MKAISPLVATAILLIITVAGGLIIYNYMSGTLASPQEYSSLSVVSAKLVISGTEGVLNIKVINIGTKTAHIEQVTILPENIVVSVDDTVAPGSTKSINIVINATSITATTQHYVIIKYDDQETEPATLQIET